MYKNHCEDQGKAQDAKIKKAFVRVLGEDPANQEEIQEEEEIREELAEQNEVDDPEPEENLRAAKVDGDDTEVENED